MRILMTGAKEYPFGSSRGADALPGGGIEYCVDALAHALAKRNAHVTVVTRRFPGQKREEHGGVRVVRLPWLPGALLRNPSYNFLAFLKTLSEEYDVMHAHGPVAAAFGWLACCLRGKKLVATPHGIAHGQYAGAFSKIVKALEAFAYSRADLVAFLSPGEKAAFKKKFGFLPGNNAVLPLGIPLAQYAKSRTQTPEFTFVYAGRLAKVKGADVLLEACRGLEARVLLAGNGPERGTLEKNAPANVVFLGERRDLPAVLAKADAFVLPSRSEGLPVALLEAMATGLPCIVTDIGLPVERNVNALVVPAGDAKALHAAMQRVAGDARLRAKLSANARKFASRYSADALAGDWLAAYRLLH
ncbi:MAG: glycosyltransferase [Candidatus Micrarchaeia archaeon]